MYVFIHVLPYIYIYRDREGGERVLIKVDEKHVLRSRSSKWSMKIEILVAFMMLSHKSMVKTRI